MTSLLPFAFRGRVSPRQATYFSLLRQRKVGKRKATLLSATLRFATGNLRCSRFAGSRRTRFAQTAASPDPRNAALLGAARRDLETDGPSLRSAFERAFALGAQGIPGHCFAWLGNGQQHLTTNSRLARAACQPFGPSEAMARSVSTPLWLRRGAERFADQGRSCLSEASSADPLRSRAPQVARSEAKGRKQQGRLFFAYFLLAKQKKVSRPPGRDPASAPRQGHPA